MPKAKLDKSRKKPNKRTIKAARNTVMISEAINGASNRELANKFNLSYQEVSEILNGKEAKAVVELGESEVTRLITDAVKVMKKSLFSSDERVALDAAKTILKSTGVLKEKVEMTHSLARPVIIKRVNGEEIILGAIVGKRE